MAATPADVRARDINGSFAGLTDEQIQVFLDDAAMQLGDEPSVWGDCYDLAQIYLAAHMMVGAAFGATAGPVTSATAGRLSISIGSGGAWAGYNTTRWGQELVALGLRCGIFGPTVAVGTPLRC